MARTRRQDKIFGAIVGIGGKITKRTPTPFDDVAVKTVSSGRPLLRRLANWIRKRKDKAAIVLIAIALSAATGCRAIVWLDEVIPDTPSCADIHDGQAEDQ